MGCMKRVCHILTGSVSRARVTVPTYFFHITGL